MKQLDSLMLKLNTDKICAVSVFDIDLNKNIFTNLTHDRIIDNYGCSEDFFESLNSENHTNLRIQEKRQNGKNAYKPIGDAFEVTFGNQENKKMEKTVPETSEKKKKKKKKKKSSFGLGLPEIFDLKMQSMERNRFEKENDKLTLENKTLLEENLALKTEKLEKTFKVEKSDSFNNMLSGAVSKLPMILGALGYPVPANAGLAGIVDDEIDYEELSDEKRGFIQVIKATDDGMVALLNVIFKNVSLQTEHNPFATDLKDLLEKYNLITE
jgi:hypothetical protein